jgi:two-component system sensor histidine kinase ChvG
MATSRIFEAAPRRSTDAAPKDAPSKDMGAAGRQAAPDRRNVKKRAFSPLTLRILLVNLVAFAILVGGVLYLDQYRTGLIDSRLKQLHTQAEIIAGALGEAATTGQDTAEIEPDRATQIIRRLVIPTETRARLFATSGDLLADSRQIIAENQVLEQPLAKPTWYNRVIAEITHILEVIDSHLPSRTSLPAYVEHPNQRAADYPEVGRALDGYGTNMVRTGNGGSFVLTAAVPVQRFRRVLGALLLSTDTTDIEQIVRAERIAIAQVSAIAFAVTALLSLFLAKTIARPVIRLAEAADRIRRGRGRRVSIPDFSKRNDEIGDLSAALTDMTRDLYARIDAIDAFAADVAHELKNPLTSLRSAAETVARAEDPEARARLTAIMLDDVRRLNRLITDIAQASRLDAELLRSEAAPVDIHRLLVVLVEGYEATAKGGPHVVYRPEATEGLIVHGMEARIGQVIRNLVDNAISFSPKDAAITIRARAAGSFVVITIEDEGPGIPEGRLDEIFSRFYSERPAEEDFGTHSGLGLSISKQIVEAHGGRISAENLYAHTEGGPEDAHERVIGARFTVLLPVDPPWSRARR